MYAHIDQRYLREREKDRSEITTGITEEKFLSKKMKNKTICYLK